MGVGKGVGVSLNVISKVFSHFGNGFFVKDIIISCSLERYSVTDVNVIIVCNSITQF